MKHVQACLCASKDRESSFHLCGSPVKLVQSCLSTRKELESIFNHCGGLLNLVQACLRSRKDLESSFYHSGGPVKPVQSCLFGAKTLQSRFNCRAGAVYHEQAGLSTRDSRFLQLRWRFEACANLFKNQERPRKQFSPLWSSYEARSSLFMCGKDLTKPF